MNIELVSPANDDVKAQESRNVHSAALGLLAALTPHDHHVTMTEEHMGEVLRYRDDADVVGITMMTKQANRAYEIADEYRRRGKKVILGGIHASVLPQEALAHADAVVVGEGDTQWRGVLDDLAADRSNGIYRSDRLVDMESVPHYRRDLYSKKATFSVETIQATRGCPYDCEFCSATLFFGRKLRPRPVASVVDEIRRLKGKNIFFSDDNIFGNPDHARELFTALKPLGIHWVGQASFKLTMRDLDLLKLARSSGCLGLFFGFESLNIKAQKEAKAFGKNGTHSLDELAAGIKVLHQHGILVMGAIVFGLDHDDKYVFEQTYDFLTRNHVALASLAVCTPYPGTRLYDRYHAEGRIFDYDWSHYDNNHVVFHPSGMSAEQLQDGRDWISREFYRPHNIVRKFWSNRRNPIVYTGLSAGWSIHNRRRYKNKGRIEQDVRLSDDATSVVNSPGPGASLLPTDPASVTAAQPVSSSG